MSDMSVVEYKQLVKDHLHAANMPADVAEEVAEALLYSSENYGLPAFDEWIGAEIPSAEDDPGLVD